MGYKMIFTDDDRKFIKDNFQNSDELLSESNVRKVLDAISDLIDEKGFEPQNIMITMILGGRLKKYTIVYTKIINTTHSKE